MMRYWTAEVTYDGRTRFDFYSPRMLVVGDFESEASERLQRIVDEEWATISPHPAPRLLSVIPGRLVLEDWEAQDAAENRREHG